MLMDLQEDLVNSEKSVRRLLQHYPELWENYAFIETMLAAAYKRDVSLAIYTANRLNQAQSEFMISEMRQFSDDFRNSGLIMENFILKVFHEEERLFQTLGKLQMRLEKYENALVESCT